VKVGRQTDKEIQTVAMGKRTAKGENRGKRGWKDKARKRL